MAFQLLGAFLSKGLSQFQGKPCLAWPQAFTAAADHQHLGFCMNLKFKLCGTLAPKLSPGFNASVSSCELLL